MLSFTGLPEISQKSLRFLDDSLCLNKTQEEAEAITDEVLNSIMNK